MAKKLLLIDGNSLFHRAYHALPPLTDKNGEMANAVFGFSNMLLKAISEVKPDYIACAFDTKAPTFRHIEFEKYKAQRVAPPPDLYPQLPKVKKVLDAFGIAYFEKEGYEADDLLATLATRALESVILEGVKRPIGSNEKKSRDSIASLQNDKSVDQVIILSGDRDCLQLVDGRVKVQMPGWNLQGTTLYGSEEVREKYGLEPHQMVDYKSLVGDPSDNVPGVSGIGPKTASQLLQKYHTLENLFKNLNKIPEALRQKLEVGHKTALAAKKLVELDRNIDLRFTINDLRFEPDWEKVRREYERLGFKSIVAKILGSANTSEVGLPRAESRGFDSSEVGQAAKRKPKSNNSDQLELI
ncbi:hypothetical protein HYU92_04550 [Candidatus Curtissbacteria bacterium]|nr:hypothetical protein [Candidatus Curtissbacteria bacterium]